MTLDFVDGMNVMALMVAIVYAITAWQSRRCSTNVNEFNNAINAILIRQTLLAEKSGVDLPSMKDIVEGLGCSMPGACPPVGWDSKVEKDSNCGESPQA